MQSIHCPSREEIQAYLLGRLELETSEILLRHLQECEVCEQTIVNLESEPDTLVELIKKDPRDANSNGEAPPSQLSVDSPTGCFQTATPLSVPKDFGQYELFSLLGFGGMGAVYLATHKNLQKQFAIKILSGSPSHESEFIARFQREMRATGRLDHPAIVRTTDAGQIDGIYYMVMDVIDGLNLSHVAKVEGKLTIPDACEIVRQSCLGIAHAHEIGIVHRDVKPSNLMLDIQGQVRILDFGLAQMGVWESGTAEITTVGQLMGTLDYMAPEQAERGGAVDYRADIYSLGATLFQLLTGRAPLAAAPNLTPFEKLRLLATHKPPKLRSFRSDVPNELSEIVDAMLSRDPSMRPASATHAAELLEPFAKDHALGDLLLHCRAATPPDDKPWSLNPILQRNFTSVPANPDGSIEDSAHSPKLTSAGGAMNGRWFTWIAGAGFLGTMLAGIFLVLETSKGQLVIDSDANVTIQIASIDEQGMPQDVDSLTIEPGTQATRLKSGRYNITIDSPTDSFLITKDVFTIKNGETVVARVSKTPASNDPETENNSAIAEQFQSPANSATYQGKSLHQWLTTLRVEREIKLLGNALTALQAIATPEQEAAISNGLFRFAKTNPTSSQMTGGIFLVLEKSNPQTAFEKMTQIIDQFSVQGMKRTAIFSLLETLKIRLDSSEPVVKAPFASFIPLLEAELRGRDLGPTHALAMLLRDCFLRFSDDIAYQEDQQQLVNLLSSTKALTNENFWFYWDFQPKRQQDHPDFAQPLSEEIQRRVLQVLKSSESSMPLQGRALLVSRKLVEQGYTLSETKKGELTQAIIAQLDWNEELVPVDFSKMPEQFAAPRWLDGRLNVYFERGATNLLSANLLLLKLNLIDICKLQSEELNEKLKAGLDQLFSRRVFDPFYERGVGGKFVRWGDLTSAGPRSELVRTRFRQLIYGQIATLLDISESEILHRFVTKTSIDIDAEFDTLLRPEKGFSASHWIQLKEYLEANKNLLDNKTRVRVATRLREMFVEVAKNEYCSTNAGKLHIQTWMIAADHFFIEELATALQAMGEKDRLKAISFNFSLFPDFQCQSTEQLSKLLDVIEEIGSRQQEAETDILKSPAINFLIQFLQDSTSVTTECQQLIVDRLDKNPSLSNERFWLSAAVKSWLRPAFRNQASSGKFPCLPLSLAIQRRAAEVVSGEKESNAKVRTQAWMLLREFNSAHDNLSTELQQMLRDAIRDQSAAVAKSLKDYVTVTYVDPSFRSEPTMTGEPKKTYPVATNELIEFLCYLAYQETFSDLTDDVVASLKTVHATCYESLKPMETLSEFELNSWPITPSERWLLSYPIGSEKLKQFLYNDWYRRSGGLLGKDMKQVNTYYEKLNAAYLVEWRKKIHPGDTLAIYITGVLPSKGEPPVVQAGTNQPVWGFPVPVSAAGKLNINGTLIEVKDLDLEQARESIREGLQGIQVTSQQVNLAFLMRWDETSEIRSVTGVALPDVSKN